MCGIFAIFGQQCDKHCATDNGNGAEHGDDFTIPQKRKKVHETFREKAYRCSGMQRHRGPDQTGVTYIEEDQVVFVHERLRIVGVAHGDQPLRSDDENITLVANGEIYDYLEISDKLSMFYSKKYTPRSDCDVIIGLYERYGDNCVKHMTGMFAFALYDRKNKKMFAARDPFGILSMYIGEDSQGNIWVASEMKCLAEHCTTIKNFPIGAIVILIFIRLSFTTLLSSCFRKFIFS